MSDPRSKMTGGGQLSGKRLVCPNTSRKWEEAAQVEVAASQLGIVK